jgi:hypothetical protein
MNPTLCRVPAYFSPGFPMPTIIRGGSLLLCLLRPGSQSKTLDNVTQLHLRTPLVDSRREASGWLTRSAMNSKTTPFDMLASPSMSLT